MSKGSAVNLWRSLSATDVMVGTLFFAASLTPSLLPRTFLTQGLLSGVAFAVGYGVGIFARWLWTYMELPEPNHRILHIVKVAAAAICALAAVASLRQAAQWQNSIRELMRLEPVDTAYPLEVGLIALTTFLVLFVIALLFLQMIRSIATRVNRVAPRRISNVIGFALAATLFWLVISGVLFRALLHATDSSYREFDALIEPDVARPTDPAKTGSSSSLLDWYKLGRAGREFISSGPTSKDISSFIGKQAPAPIRVYVGLRSAVTPAQRAKLALDELKRVGGFDRSVLIVITPTGSGWVDPEAMNSIEYLRRGDVASVAMQYSYLASWMALLTEPDYGADASRALFREIYGYWTTLPKDHRPKMYLYGLSLGALHSEQSTDLIEVLGDPFNGALWSGPPYASRIWRTLTRDRNPGSPAWLPRFRDGSFVRFMNQEGSPAADASWGPMRIVYLQYASDPVTFFDYADLYREPDWMMPPRGPDVSPKLRWYPVVTFLQLAIDMFMATEAPPIGFGHVFAPEHYIDAWIEVTDVRDWSPEEITRLKQLLKKAP